MSDYIGFIIAGVIGASVVLLWMQMRAQAPIWRRRATLRDIAALDRKLKTLAKNDGDDALLEAKKRQLEVEDLDARIQRDVASIGK